MRDVTVELKALRLHGVASAWCDLSEQGIASGLDASRWLVEHLQQVETTDRSTRSVQHQMSSARFLVHRDLAGFDFDASVVDQKLVHQFAMLEFTEAAHNVVLVGGPGTTGTLPNARQCSATRDDHRLTRSDHASLPHRGDGQRSHRFLHSRATAKKRVEARKQAREGGAKADTTDATHSRRLATRIHYRDQEVKDRGKTYTYPQPTITASASTPGSLLLRRGQVSCAASDAAAVHRCGYAAAADCRRKLTLQSPHDVGLRSRAEFDRPLLTGHAIDGLGGAATAKQRRGFAEQGLSFLRIQFVEKSGAAQLVFRHRLRVVKLRGRELPRG